MQWTSETQRRAFRIAAAATLPALLAFMLAGRPAHAEGQAAPPAATQPAASLKLFPDSTLMQGDRISVEVIGRGPDVVLIPGLASSRETYLRTAERLRGKYRLHLVQVDGFAGAPPQANASGPVYLPTVEAIDAYIRQARLKSPAVVGHSLGGLMTLQLALDHPHDVGKIMIVDALAFYAEIFGGPTMTADAARPIADGMGAQILAQSDDAYAQGAVRTYEGMITAPADRERLKAWMLSTSRPVMVKAMQEDLTTDLRPRMAALSVPVTVFHEAALEPLVKADYAAAPNKTLVSAAAGAKHFLMYDDPAGFDAALDAFLAR